MNDGSSPLLLSFSASGAVSWIRRRKQLSLERVAEIELNCILLLHEGQVKR